MSNLKTRFRVDEDLRDWATKIVKAMRGDFKLEGVSKLGCDNDVRIWYRNLVTDKLECKLLSYNPDFS